VSLSVEEIDPRSRPGFRAKNVGVETSEYDSRIDQPRRIESKK
jgi:hypothetical protein